MASSINTTYVKQYNSAGLAVNSPLIVNKGDATSFSVLAHQIDWRTTTFGNIDISTKPGTTYTEKLLNTIESYICSYVSSTGVTNNPIIGTNGDKTYINVNGKKSNEIYISYSTKSIHSERAWNLYQYKNLTRAENNGTLENYKCGLLFSYQTDSDTYLPAYFDNRLMFDCISGCLESNLKGFVYGTADTATKLSNASVLINNLTDNTICAYIGGRWSNNLTIAYATTASYLTSNPSFKSNDKNVQIAITAGGKTSSWFTVPYSQKSGTSNYATDALNSTYADKLTSTPALTITPSSSKYLCYINVTAGGKTSTTANLTFPNTVDRADLAGTASSALQAIIAEKANTISQFKNTSKSGKSELLFASHSTDDTDPQTLTTYYDRSIYVDHNNGNGLLVSYGFCVAKRDGSIYDVGYVTMANGGVLHQSFMDVNSAYLATKLKNSRTISLTGAVTGSISFDGSSNVSMSTTISKNSLIGNNIELNLDKSLKNYGGFIDFHYVDSTGQFTYMGAYTPSPTDFTSQIIETAEGKLSVNGVQCVYSGIAYANAFYQTSDINYKNIISYDCNLSVTDIANAPIIKFTWKESPDNSYQIGTIAQYWQTYLPESIGENEKLSFNYSVVGTISGIVNARKIVELEKENKELKQEIKELKEKMDKILQYINI